jgi:hypothetical protein
VRLAEAHWLTVVKPDVDVATDGSLTCRIKLSVSFKYEDSWTARADGAVRLPGV